MKTILIIILALLPLWETFAGDIDKSRLNIDEKTDAKSVQFIKNKLKLGVEYDANNFKDSELRVILLGDYRCEPMACYEFLENGIFHASYVENFSFDRAGDKPKITSGKWRIKNGSIYIKHESLDKEICFAINTIMFSFDDEEKVFEISIKFDRMFVFNSEKQANGIGKLFR